MADERDLDPHLAERLRDATDVADFSRGAVPEAREVARTQALPDHLGGQAVSDTFVRGGKTPRPPVQPPGEKGLPSHLKSRLSEVSDELRRGTGDLDPTIEAYRQLRRRLGGA